MAIYHFSGQIISRYNPKTGGTRSSVACAAYRSGESLNDIGSGTSKYYARDVQPETYMLTPDNAPEWANNREILWNKVEQVEKAYNAQLAREFNVALPIELSNEEQTKLAIEFCKKAFVERGMVADLSIHRDHDNNPHFHVMLTMREFDEKGNFKSKSRNVYELDSNGKRIKLDNGSYKRIKIETNDWNNKENMKVWRKMWENMTNSALERNGINERISCESYRNSNIEYFPTVHEGYVVRKLEAKGINTEVGDRNRNVKEYNNVIVELENYKRKKENAQLTRIVRCFTPNEKKVIRETAKEFKFYIDDKSVKERLKQLEKWENSVLRKEYDDKAISRIFKERDSLYEVRSILENEADRFVKKYYPDIDTILSVNDKISIVDSTVNKGNLLELDELKETIETSRENEVRAYLSGIIKDTNRYSFRLVEEIDKLDDIIAMESEKQDVSIQKIPAYGLKKIDSAKSAYHIYQPGKESLYFVGKNLSDGNVACLSELGTIADTKQLWKRANEGDLSWVSNVVNINDARSNQKLDMAIHKRDNLENAIEILEKIYNMRLQQIYPSIMIEQYNIMEKEILLNAKMYYGEQLTIDDIRNGVPAKYDTATQEQILSHMLKGEHDKINQKYSGFDINNETYVNMFIFECKTNPDINKKLVDDIQEKYQDKKIGYYNDVNGERVQQNNNYGAIKNAALSLLIKMAHDEPNTRNNLAKKKKKRHKKHVQDMSLS